MTEADNPVQPPKGDETPGEERYVLSYHEFEYVCYLYYVCPFRDA